MPLTYICELHNDECIIDEEGFGSCGDENIRRNCLWGRWTTKTSENIRG
jgi:hypothetical protein